MIYPSSFEQKLGFDKIREHLKNLCLCPLGQQKVDAMQFSADFISIDLSLHLASEMKDVCLSTRELPINHFFDLTSVLHRLKLIGSFPDVQEAWDMMRSLATIQSIIHFFTSSEENDYAHLRKLTSQIQYDASVIHTLQSILSSQGTVRDQASPRLAEIRSEMFQKQSEVNKRINRILKDAQTHGWVDNESPLSMRDGRLVIPIQAVYKRKIRGIVHDESSTGKTIFIEPEEIVELNNDLRELEYAERREIVIILTDFATGIRPLIDSMMDWYEFLGEIDFIRSKALFSIKVGSYLPSLIEKPVIYWYGANHPLLYLHLKNESKPIVPLDIQLDAKNRILLISGPNAGGKSVCLQTVALLQYMLQCGMLVPVKPASEMGMFKNILIDIGDEQSIENDLSTYSSRLLNMKNFLKIADQDTLILIDEFGSGTEPQIGGAIAQAILEELNKKECFGVITTHYTNLKHYAMSAEGVVNGAMLYDTSRLQPLFVLQMGEPGSSFAFEIARKIGLPEELLKNAESQVGEEHIAFDKNLREILRDKHYWERKRESIKENEKKLDVIVDRYEKELTEINRLRKEILSKAKQDAESILSGANKQIEQTIRTIKEAQADKEKTQVARKKLEETKKNIEIVDAEKDALIERKMELIKQRQERKEQRESQPTQTESRQEFKLQKPQSISTGDKVRLKDQPEVFAEVLKISGAVATLAIGHIQMNVAMEKLQRISENEYKKPMSFIAPPSSNTEMAKRRMEFKPRIDLRGKRGDEALKEVMIFIDEAMMFDVSELAILHGKGNGILRELIRDYLKSIQEIESYNDAPNEQGGSGITLVKFK